MLLREMFPLRSEAKQEIRPNLTHARVYRLAIFQKTPPKAHLDKVMSCYKFKLWA